MRINSLTIISNKGEKYKYDFTSQLVFINASNDFGKTRVVQTLDYLLGSSSRDEIFKYTGMDNIESFVLEIINNGLSSFFKRNNNKECFYKPDDKSSFQLVSFTEYNQLLTKNINNSNEKLVQLKSYLEEDIKHRTFTFLNFIDEKGYGLTRELFQKFSDPSLFYRAPKIIKGLFNRNLKEIEKLKAEIKDLKKDLVEKNRTQIKVEIISNDINRSLSKLGIKFSFNGDIKELNQELENFKEKDKQDIIPVKQSIGELRAVKNNIDEKIKVLKQKKSNIEYNMLKQNLSLELLENLDTFVSRSPELEYLIEPIKSLISNKEESIGFLDYNDYKTSITQLTKYQTDVIRKMKKNEINLNMYSIEEKEEEFSYIKKLSEKYILINKNEINKLKSQIKLKENLVKNLSNQYDVNLINSIGIRINGYYNNLKGKGISFVKEDYLQNGFEIEYNPKGNKLITTKKVEIYNEKTKKNEIIKELYFPGSLARETVYQVSAYLSFLEEFVSNDYPVLPIFVLDSVSQPFSKNKQINNLSSIKHLLEKCLINNDIQIIWIDFDDDAIIDEYNALKCPNKKKINLMSIESKNTSGFNPFHETGK